MDLEDKNISDNYFSLGLTSTFKTELNVDRRSVDIRRMFFDAALLIETGQNILINEDIIKAVAEYGMKLVPGTEMPKSILFMP